MWRSLAIGLIALIGGLGAAPAASAETLVSATGVVGDGESADSQIWFKFTRDQKRFVVNPAEVADANAFWEALKASNSTGRSLVIRYDADAGFIDFATSEPTFTVRELVYDGATLAGAKARPGAAEGYGGRRAAEAALARGVALLGHGDLKGAREAVNRALGNDGLDARLRALGLKARANSMAAEAYDHLANTGPAYDRLLFLALADYDAWRELSPDEADAAFSVAMTLRELGAYEEALTIYRALAQTKEHVFWAYIRTGATYRTMGEHDNALAALDDLVKAEGPQAGMAYHFHRGWTLTELGRLEEAEKELAAGFKDQPDYEWAYLRRACVLARLGRLGEAVIDHDRGLALMREGMADGVVSPARAYDLKWAQAQGERLKAAAAADPKGKLDLPCLSDWHGGDARRTRSPLLPKDWLASHPAPAQTPSEPPPPSEPVRTETAA